LIKKSSLDPKNPAISTNFYLRGVLAIKIFNNGQNFILVSKYSTRAKNLRLSQKISEMAKNFRNGQNFGNTAKILI